jgi:hypothetical protein
MLAATAVTVDLVVVLCTTAAAFLVTALLFDPEQRFIGRGRGRLDPGVTGRPAGRGGG